MGKSLSEKRIKAHDREEPRCGKESAKGIERRSRRGCESNGEVREDREEVRDEEEVEE